MHKYEVSCKVYKKEDNIVGGVKARFDTFDFEEDFKFTVEQVDEATTSGMIDHSSGVVH
jgi:hypothetical protein